MLSCSKTLSNVFVNKIYTWVLLLLEHPQGIRVVYLLSLGWSFGWNALFQHRRTAQWRVSYATYFSCLKLSQTREWTFKTCLIILVFEDFDNFISMIVRLRDRYLKNDVSKSIVHVIKHANFSFIRYILLKLFGKTDKWR